MIEQNKETQPDSDVRYKLNAQQSYVRDQPIIIEFTLENLSSEDLLVLKWYTPFEGLKGKIFHVSCDGKEIPYEGPMVKRGDPTKNDYLYVASGSSASAEVNLSDTYTLPRSNECKVEFKGRIFDLLTSSQTLPRKSEGHHMINIKGNSIAFTVA
jgi:hypothetical protein